MEPTGVCRSGHDPAKWQFPFRAPNKTVAPSGVSEPATVCRWRCHRRSGGMRSRLRCSSRKLQLRPSRAARDRGLGCANSPRFRWIVGPIATASFHDKSHSALAGAGLQKLSCEPDACRTMAVMVNIPTLPQRLQRLQNSRFYECHFCKRLRTNNLVALFRKIAAKFCNRPTRNERKSSGAVTGAPV